MTGTSTPSTATITTSTDGFGAAAVSDDPYQLHRFTEAQNQGDAYQQAVDELRRGHKTTHWIWFVFPQIAGLGKSPTSQHFAIKSLDEAKAYLAHPLLGPRLVDSAGIVAESSAPSAAAIFGDMDAMKLHSSMTLFLRARPAQPVFQQVLDKYYDGRPDEGTDRLL